MNNKSSILAFRQTTLGEIARKDGHGIVDGPFGSNLRASEYVSYGIPVIRGSNLSLGLERFHTNDYVFVSKETANRLNRSLCQPDDIIFTKKGTLGQTGIVPRTEPYKIFLLSSNQMKLSVDIKIANPLFVYYYVSSPANRERIIREAMTTGVPKINLEYLRRFPISLPPLPTQKKIASILSAYDDLIENNTRRIKILEEMAQTLYHEWFVKFRFPGHEQTKMVDSELGLIPEGWEVVSIGELINRGILKNNQDGNHGEKHPKANDYVANGVPFIMAKDIINNILDLENCNFISYDQAKSLRVGFAESGDVLITHKATMGRVAIVPQVKDFIVLSPQVTYFRIADKRLLNSSFIYCTFNSDRIQNILITQSEQSTRKFMGITEQRKIKIIYPNLELIQKFGEVVGEILQLKQCLHSKNTKLKLSRDLLLPKLISGEIDVEHLDITTEDIAA